MDRRSFLAGLGAAASLASVAKSRRPIASNISSLPFSDELDERIGAAMQRLSAAAGLSVAVYSPEGCYTRGFGVTDVTTGQRVDADTAFYIASSTKPLTSLAFAVLAHRGQVDLDAPIARWAPDAAFPAAIRPDAVTLRHLLSHSSGIDCDPVAFRLAFSGQHDPATLWRLLSACAINAKAPFGTFEYTNTGYNIATILSDRRLGLPWQDLLDDELFRPMGMRRTSARMSRARSGGWSVARPHIVLPEGVTRIALEKSDATMHSAGGVIMSASDAVLWLELMSEAGMVGGRRILPAQAVMATREPFAKLDREFAGYTRKAYGLGWYHVPFRDELMLHHFGAFAGARAHVSYLPARRTGVAAFVNDSSVASQLADVVADFVYDRSAGRADAGKILDTRIEQLIVARDRYFEKLTADRLARQARAWTLRNPLHTYAGRFRNDAFGEIIVSAGKDALDIRFGAMRSPAGAGSKGESVRVEFIPLQGEEIGFAAASAALTYQGQTYSRVAA